MSMSKKDYERIAAEVRFSLKPTCPEDYMHSARTVGFYDGRQAALHELANNLAQELGRDNPRFDRARFLKACGIEVGE